MFYNFTSVTNIKFGYINTENMTSMSQMFRNCKKLSKLDVDDFNTSKVTSMHETF